ncbi:MAG: pyridoxal phosphate-dependent aminotransferase [Acidobacteria bacterium]|nr:pyridoxal phosphate-dependent aminotransferase [Acidobacteriota bacterium]
MTEVLAPYMYWAKTRPTTTFDLAASNMLACAMDDLPGAREAIELTATNDEGYAPLAEAIASHYGVTPDRVVHAIGCSGANFLLMAAHVRAGDHVLMERPGYDPMAGACRLLGATVNHFDRRADNGFAVDVEAMRRAMTAATRLVIITSPHNPSGATLDRDTLVALDAFSADTGVTVLIDEAYLDITRLLQRDPERFPRAASISARLVSTSSLTKSYGLNGLRCGWAVVPVGMADRLRRVRDVVDGVGSAPVDRLSTFAFSLLPALAERARLHVRQNLSTMRAFLDAHPQLRPLVPLDATITFPRVEGLVDASDFAARAARDFDVTVIPGRFFSSPAHVRLSLAGSAANLSGGLAQLAAAMQTV